jgi:hypothetical protein
MTARRLRLLFLSSLVSGLLAGCQLAPPVGASLPAASSAQITAITPETAQPLRAGDHATLKVDVAYGVAAKAGTLTLLVLAADNSSLARDVQAVGPGHGKVTLQAGFTVPDSGVVRVFTALVVQGQDSTSAVDGRAYEVVR